MLREAALATDEGETNVDLDDEAIDEIDKVARQLVWEFGEYVHNVWSKLLNAETTLHEQIEEMGRMFEMNINDMVGSFLEGAQEYFSQLRALEIDYNENLLPMVMDHLNNIEDDVKTGFLALITEDKEALDDCLQGSHFLHLQIIDDRQDRLSTRLKDWKTRFLNNMFRYYIINYVACEVGSELGNKLKFLCLQRRNQ